MTPSIFKSRLWALLFLPLMTLVSTAQGQWRTVGQTTGSMDIGGVEDAITAYRFQTPNSLVARYMRVFVRQAGSSLPRITMGIYSDITGANGPQPGQLLTRTAEITAVVNEWNTAAVINQIEMQPGSYFWLCLNTNTGSGDYRIGGVSVNPGGLIRENQTYGQNWPQNWGSVNPTEDRLDFIAQIVVTDSTTQTNGTIRIEDGNRVTSATSRPLVFTTLWPSGQMRYALYRNSPTDTANALWGNFTPSGTVDLTNASEGLVRVFAQFRENSSSTPRAWVADSIVVDRTPPTGTITTSGVFGPTSWAGSISGTATDAVSSVDSVKLTIRRSSDNQYWNGSGWTSTLTWVRTSNTTWSYLFPASNLSDGVTYTVQMQAFDRAGNVTPSPYPTSTFAYSATSPSGSFTIVQRNGFTNDEDPRLNITFANATEMRIGYTALPAYNDTAAAVWRTVRNVDSISLGTSDGLKRISIQFRNSVGVRSTWVSQDVTLDKTPPTVSVNPLSGSFSLTAGPTFSGSAADISSGLDSIRVLVQRPGTNYWSGTGWVSVPFWIRLANATSPWSFSIPASGLTVEGQYTVQAQSFDKAGNVSTVASQPFTVDNTEPPRVTVQPKDTTVLVGTVATFRTVTTSTISSYAWFRVGRSDTLSRAAAFSFTPVAADSGARFECVVTNSKGSARDTALLRVVSPVRAKWAVSPITGQDNATVFFNDSSEGSIASWRIDFGVGNASTGTLTSRPRGISHNYSQVGDYTAKLVVTGVGPAGRDSTTQLIRIYRATANPLRLTTRFLASNRVEYTITGIDSIASLNRGLPLFAASNIGIWFSTAGRPDTSRPPAMTIPVTGSTRTDVLSVTPPATASDTLYTLWAAPIWTGGKPLDGYNPINTSSVRMKPLNRLSLAGTYLGNRGLLPAIDLEPSKLDSARIMVGSAHLVDSVGVDRLVLSYGFGPSALTNRDTILIGRFLAGVANQSYPWNIANSAFRGDTQRVYLRLVQIGRNQLVSDPVDAQFVVGWPRPENPIRLTIPLVTSSTASLRWDSIGIVDSIRVIYRRDSVALGPTPEPPTTLYTIANPTPTSRGWVVVGLESERTYGFGVQIKKNLLWSEVTSASRATVTTDSADESEKVPNTTRIDSIWFDPGTNSAVILYSLQLITGKTLMIGVTAATDSSTAILMSPADATIKATRTVTQSSGRIELSFGSELKSNTQYFVALWLKSDDGVKAGPWAAPTDVAVRKVRTSETTWQAVRLWERDTLYAFSKQFVLYNEAPLNPLLAYSDTVRLYSPASLPPGLTAVSTGYVLHKSSSVPFYVGFKLQAQDYSINDVAIYRDSSGVFSVEHGTFVDAANGIVWVRTNRILTRTGEPLPFIAMIDTQRPKITLNEADTSDFATLGAEIIDKLKVEDNISNVFWQLFYARNSEPYQSGPNSRGFLCGNCQGGATTDMTIPASAISEDIGVRAFVVISDGRHRDTINLSRRIIRENSDIVTFDPMKWTPLTVTAELDQPQIKQALTVLSKDGQPWAYDNTKMRIFRWYPNIRNQTSSNKWVEYSEQDSDVFSFVPGRVIWVKSRKSLDPIGFGPGLTASLKEPYSVDLAPGQFTDIALPFRFDAIYVEDILAASGAAADSIGIYAWSDSGRSSSSALVSKLIYSKAIGRDFPVYQDPRTVLEWSELKAYTIYNPGQNEVTLKIPPIPRSSSLLQRPLPKAKQGPDHGVWSIDVTSRTRSGQSLGRLLCGSSRRRVGALFLPLPPSFSPVYVAVYNREKGAEYGMSIVGNQAARGYSWEIAFVNNSGSAETVEYDVQGNLPEGSSVWVRDAATGTISQVTGPLTVALGPESRSYREIVVGDRAFLEDYQRNRSRLALIGCMVNPFKGGMRIAYSLPAMNDIAQVTFSMFDLRGRCVWRAHTDRNLTAGHHSLSWDGRVGAGPLSAGTYVLRMSVVDSAGRILGSGKMTIVKL